jgi:gas vesicle protein
MSNNSESSRVGGYLIAFAIGALVGTGAALLYAPRSGQETRELLAKKGRDLKGRASEALEDATDFIQGKKAELAAAVEAGKDAMREERAKHHKAA